MKRSIFILICITFFLSACEKSNLKAGRTSLNGTWNVTKIITTYGERRDLGIDNQEDTEETGDLGQFEFTENELTANYTRVDTLRSIESSWELERDKVNAGFFKVEQYTLVLDEESFKCEFGDETKDAERNAIRMRLIFETMEIGAYEQYILELEKE